MTVLSDLSELVSCSPAMRRKKRTYSSDVRRLAQARIEAIWKKANVTAETDPSLARRQMRIAGRVAQKARIKVPLHMKRGVCKNCGTLLIPGGNCRVRMRNNRSKHVTVTCLACGAIRRFYVRAQR